MIFYLINIIATGGHAQELKKINFSKYDPIGAYEDWDKHIFFTDIRSKNAYLIDKPVGSLFSTHYDTSEYAIYMNSDSVEEGDTISLIFGMDIIPGGNYAYKFYIRYRFNIDTKPDDSMEILFSDDGINWQNALGEKYFQWLCTDKIIGNIYLYPFLKQSSPHIYEGELIAEPYYLYHNNIDTFLLKFNYYKGSNEKSEGFLISYIEFEFVPIFSVKELLRNEILIYPNPVRSKATIKLPRECYQFKKIDMEVFDSQGTLVKHVSFSEKNQFSISLQSLKSGTYFIKLTDTEKKLLKTQIIIKI